MQSGIAPTVCLYYVLSATLQFINVTSCTDLLITGSWDATLKLWDPRIRQLVGQFQQPERVYAMDCSFQRVIVGTAARHVWIWDLRRMAEPEQRRESSLKYQTRCITAYPDGTGAHSL